MVLICRGGGDAKLRLTSGAAPSPAHAGEAAAVGAALTERTSDSRRQGPAHGSSVCDSAAAAAAAAERALGGGVLKDAGAGVIPPQGKLTHG